MAEIKIKFIDSFNLSTNVDISINFVCSGIPYQRIRILNDLLEYQDISGDWVTCCNEIGWTNYKYQIIEIDPTQSNFQTFITAMVSNFEGVELEIGTYKWSINNVSDFINSAFDLNFTSNSTNFTHLNIINGLKFFINYGDILVYNTGIWNDDNYKTIVLNTNQYVPYDFYNYAILGNELVKQQLTSYTITYSLTNCTSDSSNPTTISDTASVIVTANRGYKLPSTITVTNATYTYEQSTGMIDLSNPTGDVTITVVAIQDDIIVYENQLTSIANAIRQVNSSSAKIKLDDMPNLIGTFAKPTGTKTITDTNVTDVRNYANAQVSDANLASANIVTGKTILGIAGSFSSDGTLDASKMLKGVIGYSKGVKYTGTIETYDGSTTITSNGTINTAGKYLPSNLTVNVPATPTQEKSVTITTNGETSVTPDTGKNLSKVTITTNVPNPTLSGNATANQVVKGATFYSDSYTKQTGTFEGIVPDGNAVAANVLKGKTFYGNGTTKLTGTIETYSGSTTITANTTLNTAGKYIPSNLTINVPTLDTSDGTITANDVLLGKIGYSKGAKVVGAIKTYNGEVR